MAIYSLKQRIFIVKQFYQSGNSTENVQKEFPKFYGDFQTPPSDNIITELIDIFEEYGNVINNKIEIMDDLNEQQEVEISTNTIDVKIEPFANSKTPMIFGKLCLSKADTIELDDDDDEDSEEFGEYLNDDTILSSKPKLLQVDIETKTSKNLNPKLKLSLKCGICDKIFNRRARYDRHMNAHKNTCIVCQKRVRDLKVHMRRHSGEKSYQCSQCGVQFHRYDRLRCHMVSHTDDRPFPCETCNKAFKTRKHLHEHAKTHLSAEDRPIKCEVCGKGFLYNVDLKKHSRIHTGEKPSLCIVCGKSFASNEILKVHNRIHTGEKPYQCPFCDEKFSRFGSLHTHKRIHTGEKPYKCNYCEKKFYDSGSRRSHEHVHIGDFPYKCLLCDKAYNHLSSLKSHMNYTHRDVPSS